MKKILYTFFFIILSCNAGYIFATDKVLETISCEDVYNLVHNTYQGNFTKYDENGVVVGTIEYTPYVSSSPEILGSSISGLCQYSWKKEIYTSLPTNNDVERLIYTKDGVPNYGAIRYVSEYVIYEYKEKFKKIAQEKQKLTQTQTNNTNATTSTSNDDWSKAKAEFDKAIEAKKSLVTQTGSTNSLLPIVENQNKKFSPKNEKKAKILITKIALLKKQLEQLQKQLESLN